MHPSGSPAGAIAIRGLAGHNEAGRGGRVGAAESRTQAQHLPAYGRIEGYDIAATGRTGSAEDEMLSRTLPMATAHVKISRQRAASAVLWKLEAPAGVLVDIVFISSEMALKSSPENGLEQLATLFLGFLYRTS